jgi:putative ABC transport system permease protein
MLRHFFVTALRNFWKFRLTTAVNILGLSLGLVCFIGTYVFLDGLTKSDMHYAKAPRIHALTQELWLNPAERTIPAFPMAAGAAAKYLKSDFPALEAVARALPLGSIAGAAEDRRLNLFLAAADGDFLKIFDFPFIAGSPQEALAATHSIVLSERTARQLFGTSNVVGRHVVLQGGVEVTVTGVYGTLPQPSHFGDSARAFLRFEGLVPMDLVTSLQGSTIFGTPSDPETELWGADIFFTYVLLPRNGSLTPEELSAGLKAFAARHVPNGGVTTVFGVIPVSHVPLRFMEGLFGGGPSIGISVFVLDTLILAIACLNYANLAMAIASTRAREIGMRKVLGARRFHLLGQYVLEALLLSAAALVVVLVCVALAIAPLNRSLGFNLQLETFADPALWLIVVALLVTVCFIGGAFPAAVLARVRPMQALRAGAIQAGPRFVPTLLVGVQFGAASFLLVFTLLIVSQNRFLQRIASNAGRDPRVVITNDTNPMRVGLDTLRAELQSDNAIKSVTAAMSAPWQSGGWHFMLRRGESLAGAPVTTILNQVSYDFFETLGIRLLAGRSFARDHGDEYNILSLYQPAPKTPNVIVDRALARQLGWPNPNDAVGKTIYDWQSGDNSPRHALFVVGVADNGYPRLIGPNTDSNLYVLSPANAQFSIIRVARDNVAGAIAHIEAVWERLAPRIPLKLQFTDDLFAEAYANFAIISRILAGLAGFAFLIALLGLFGMAIHVTNRRRREIGIRKILGARTARVVFMLLRDFARPVVIANIIAWPLAFFAGRTYLNLFVERVPLTPWPFLLSLVAAVFIAWVTVGGQALRAAAVKPGEVLRSE